MVRELKAGTKMIKKMNSLGVDVLRVKEKTLVINGGTGEQRGRLKGRREKTSEMYLIELN